MKKNLRLIATLFVMMLCANVIKAQSVTIDSVTYECWNGSTAFVARCEPDLSHAKIKSNVTINGYVYPVTEIGASAFADNDSLRIVEIPEGVTSIGEGAFRYCYQLNTIILPKSLSQISKSAFSGCYAITNIHIGDMESWLSIQYGDSDSHPNTPNMYDKCVDLYLDEKLLTEIEIPNTITAISAYSFANCGNITRVTMPNSVFKIGDTAFYNCEKLDSIVFSTSLTEIGYLAFSGCDSLSSVALPNSVIKIGNYAFSDCRNLTNVTIPTGVTEIADGLFNGSGLTSIVIPNGVTKIGSRSFNGTKLHYLELPASVVSIGSLDAVSQLRCNSNTPPSLLDGLGSVEIVYVPAGCYYAYKNVYPWSSKIIVDGKGVNIDVTVTPGFMGDEILNYTAYLSDVNYLTLRGAINETDIANIQNSMPNLLAIDMSDLDMEVIPDNMFYNRSSLLSIILPDNVKTIGCKAFYRCMNLEKLTLPEGLERIADGNMAGWEDNVYYDNPRGVFSECRSLKSISFPSTLTHIGNCAFYGCTSLTELTFKQGLTSIGDYAFKGCYNLNTINFNEGLSSIGLHAFSELSRLKSIVFPKSFETLAAGAFYNCYSLEEINFKGLKSIGNENENVYEYEDTRRGAFEGCYNLKNVILPEGLENIYQYTFYGCGSLTSMKIPEGVKYIGRNAFASCVDMKFISLPSTLLNCSSTPFANCSQLSEVSCLALFPPALADGLLTLDDMGLALKRTLNVPEWTLNIYKLTSGWAAFSEILPISGVYPFSISIIGDAVLSLPTTGFPANYKPELIFPYWFDSNYPGPYGNTSSLHLRGTGSLALSKFYMDCGYQASMKQLLNEEATLIADTVELSMSLNATYYDNYYNNRTQWHFLSFPFDVKVADITTDCDWVIRRYDGNARAKADYNNTWVTVPYDGTLNAGEGYIWACNDGRFVLSAVDNANKNLIFANTKREQPLQEYAAELISNSSWNLVGNPFPCYYNTNEMDYTAPITVWENNTYAAYSPVDDNYVLSPFEAFFVQCPAGVKSLGFKPEGRQLTATSVAPSTPATAPSRIQAKAERQVINLVLSNANGADRTRIVINENAKMDYELTCDAAKFMSDDAHMPQIYSVSNEEMFAINERPMGNGVVKLGTHFGMAGTYTIAMQSASNMMVVLVDHKTGIETDLTAGDYTFSAEAGDCNRFEVRMYADEETTAIDAVAADTKVVAMNNAIVVTTSTDADVELYNAAGSLMAVGKGKSMTFDAAQGMYIVKVNGVSHKVAVVK